MAGKPPGIKGLNPPLTRLAGVGQNHLPLVPVCSPNDGDIVNPSNSRHGTFFGLPIDIRHITFSSAYFAFS
ncbi:MAG: site-specific recombinase, partial [Burkholderiales bacterium]|nr:site-specific recombinase [Burkholderiales bacterium]